MQPDSFPLKNPRREHKRHYSHTPPERQIRTTSNPSFPPPSAGRLQRVCSHKWRTLRAQRRLTLGLQSKTRAHKPSVSAHSFPHAPQAGRFPHSCSPRYLRPHSSALKAHTQTQPHVGAHAPAPLEVKCRRGLTKYSAKCTRALPSEGTTANTHDLSTIPTSTSLMGVLRAREARARISSSSVGISDAALTRYSLTPARNSRVRVLK